MRKEDLEAIAEVLKNTNILVLSDEIYSELKKDLPKIGSIMETEHGIGKVVSVDVFKRTYSVDLKEKGIIVLSKEKNNGSN